MFSITMEFELRDFNTISGNLRQKAINHPEAWQRVQETAVDLSDPSDTILDIGEAGLSEETPLLATETAAGSTGFGLGTPVSAVTAGGAAVANFPVAAAPFLAGAAAVGVGGLVNAHWPGHEYLGPGTDLDAAGKPVDKDDEIAKEHDVAYTKVKTAADIVDADSRAIGAFEDDFAATGNIHSKISSGLLGAKQAIEHYTGPLYPQVKNETTYQSYGQAPLVES